MTIYRHTQPVWLFVAVFAALTISQLLLIVFLYSATGGILRYVLLCFMVLMLLSDLAGLYLMSASTNRVDSDAVLTGYRSSFAGKRIPFSDIKPETIKIVRSPLATTVQFETKTPILGMTGFSNTVKLYSDEPEVLQSTLANALKDAGS